MILEISPGDLLLLRCLVRQLKIWERIERYHEVARTEKRNARLVFTKVIFVSFSV